MKVESEKIYPADNTGDFLPLSPKARADYPVLSDLSFAAAILSGLLYGSFLLNSISDLHQVELLRSSRQEAYFNEFTSRYSTAVSSVEWSSVLLGSAVLLFLAACMMLSKKPRIGVGLHLIYVVMQISGGIALGGVLTDSLFMPVIEIMILIWAIALAGCVYPIIVVATIITIETARRRPKAAGQKIVDFRT